MSERIEKSTWKRAKIDVKTGYQICLLLSIFKNIFWNFLFISSKMFLFLCKIVSIDEKLYLITFKRLYHSKMADKQLILL